jgi:predicted nucleotidyltransferase
MKPAPQSHLRYPLTRLLGTEAGVRVLRELALHGGELTTTLLSQRTGITDQSVRNTLATLSDARLLRRYGQGRAAAYQLDPAHPVARMLVALFQAESERVGTIYQSIRAAAQALDPRPGAVWMYGSTARHQDGPLSDLDLLVIVDEADLTDRLADAFRAGLEPLEEEHRLTISVVPLSLDDVARLSANDEPFWRAVVRDAVALVGPRPEALLSTLKIRARLSSQTEAGGG